MPVQQDEIPRYRDEDADEERRYWESVEDDRLAEEESERAAARRAGIEKMESWFFEQLEDPELDTPRDSENQTFFYPWGGPFDAGEVLRDQFAHDYDERWISDAVERIEKTGTLEWAPTSHGEYYEHPEPHPDDEEPARLSDQVLARLDALEALMGELQVRPTAIGHNGPPDDIGLPPYTAKDAVDLKEAIRDTRSEVQSSSPDPKSLVTLSERFRRIAGVVGTWMAKKADLAVDETIKASIKAVSWATAIGLLTGIGDDLLELAKALIGRL